MPGKRSAPAPTASSSGTNAAPAPSPTKQWLGVEGGIARSYGHCMTMGTASTMTAIAEAMGLTLPGASSIPAADANHQRMSTAVRPPHRRDGLGGPDPRPDRHPRRGAQRRDRRDGHRLLDQRRHPPDRHGPPRRVAARPSTTSTRIGRTTPVIANVRPSGKDYLMEDFFYAGGLRALMKQLGDKLDPTAITVTGRTLGDGLDRRQDLQRRRHPPARRTRSTTKARSRC